MSWLGVGAVAAVPIFAFGAVRNLRAWVGSRRYQRELAGQFGRRRAAVRTGSDGTAAGDGAAGAPSGHDGHAGTAPWSRPGTPGGREAGCIEESRAGRRSHALPWWPPALDAVLGGLDEVRALNAIDPHVIMAMDFWLKPDLSHFGTLQETVAEASSSPTFDVWLDTLKGYVGEQVAADVLESQGATVELAAAPNQAGWDLLVNGELFNVKVGIDPEHIARHFERYPDVGVITSPELAAQLPEHADQIIALPELSNSAIEPITQQTVEGVEGVGWDFHLPVITLAMSTFRELDLLSSGDTDVVTSLRNVALDAAGTGGGAYLGGQIGASLGTALMGLPGAVFGGMVGGILGAVFGRSVSNHIKTGPLRAAIATFEAEPESARREMQRLCRRARKETLAYIREVEADLRQALADLEQAHRRKAAEAKAGFEGALREFVAAVPVRLEEAARRLDEQQKEILQAMPRSPWWVRTLWPAEQDLQWWATQVWFEGGKRVLRRAAAQIRRIGDRRSAPEAYTEVLAVLRDVRLHVPELADTIVRLREAYGRTLVLMGIERRQAAIEAKVAVRDAGMRIGSFIAEQARHVKAWADKQAALLRSLRDRVNEEARKLGLSYRLW